MYYDAQRYVVYYSMVKKVVLGKNIYIFPQCRKEE